MLPQGVGRRQTHAAELHRRKDRVAGFILRSGSGVPLVFLHFADADRLRRIDADIDAVALGDVVGDQLRMQADLVRGCQFDARCPIGRADVQRAGRQSVAQGDLDAVARCGADDQRFARRIGAQASAGIQVLGHDIDHRVPVDDPLQSRRVGPTAFVVDQWAVQRLPGPGCGHVIGSHLSVGRAHRLSDACLGDGVVGQGLQARLHLRCAVGPQQAPVAECQCHRPRRRHIKIVCRRIAAGARQVEQHLVMLGDAHALGASEAGIGVGRLELPFYAVQVVGMRRHMCAHQGPDLYLVTLIGAHQRGIGVVQAGARERVFEFETGWIRSIDWLRAVGLPVEVRVQALDRTEREGKVDGLALLRRHVFG